MATGIKYVSMNNIKPNMILAKDVVTLSGLVLMTKDTVLNDTNIPKLLSQSIEYVAVVVQDQSKKNTLPAHSIYHIPEKPAFKIFNNTYEEKTEDIRKHLNNIGNGGQIDLHELNSITGDIMHKLKYKSDLFVFLGFVHSTDEHVYTHSINVALLSNLFGRWLDFNPEELNVLTIAALLHDVGKTHVPYSILTKAGRLTPEEFEIMKKHTIYGHDILKDHDLPEEVKLTPLMHHEKIDGTGYPKGLNGDQIISISKIVTICDIYDAMTSNRVYREKICPFEVIHSFETKFYSELDTKYLLTFLQNIAYNYMGNWVVLSDDREAEVVFIHKLSLSKPIVRTKDNEVIDLSTRRDVTISRML